jgi:hypothetical protein
MNGEKPNEEKVRDEVPNVKREGWSAEKVSEEATNKESDEIYRQISRGDETKGDADERDIAGSPLTGETPYEREETKK